MKKIQVVLIIFASLVLITGWILLQTDKAFATPNCCVYRTCAYFTDCEDECRMWGTAPPGGTCNGIWIKMWGHPLCPENDPPVWCNEKLQ